MVHMAIEEPNDARLKVAGDLAENFNSRVIGISACDHSPPAYYTDTSTPIVRDLIQADRDYLNRRNSELEAEFSQQVVGRAKTIEWRTGLSRPTEFVAREARAADLIITGANNGEMVTDPFRHLDANSLLMTAGRPVLMVPPEASWLQWRHVLVLWKDTREARRAVADALPILTKAGEVRVVEVVEDGSFDLARTRVDDVAGWLKHHGASASARPVPVVEDAASDVQTLAADMGADLIVAGAYGRTRFSEWIFGGVTRTLLNQTDRCVLLSH
jgi:nucleotide-binding universal stress UspA family protein